MSKRNYTVILVIVLIFMSAYVVSAGIGDWWKGITGRATSQQANASIILTGSNPVSVTIHNYTLVGAAVTPVEDSYINVSVIVTVEDLDGVADINDSSVSLNVSRAGETEKINQTCAYAGAETSTARNFTCAFVMWYFDAAGIWTLSGRASDYGTLTYVENVTTFNYLSLAAMQMSPHSLTWPGVSPGQTNITSNNDPLLLNNTGNYPSDNVTVTGINLVGETTPSYYIDAQNFTVDIATGGAGCSGAACVECGVSAATGGVIMQNNTEREIFLANLTRGNHSINNGQTGQEQLWFCMYLIPSNIISQTYTTPNEWTFTIR